MWRDGERIGSDVMVKADADLADRQIELLWAYYASLEAPKSGVK